MKTIGRFLSWVFTDRGLLDWLIAIVLGLILGLMGFCLVYFTKSCYWYHDAGNSAMMFFYLPLAGLLFNLPFSTYLIEHWEYMGWKKFSLAFLFSCILTGLLFLIYILSRPGQFVWFDWICLLFFPCILLFITVPLVNFFNRLRPSIKNQEKLKHQELLKEYNESLPNSPPPTPHQTTKTPLPSDFTTIDLEVLNLWKRVEVWIRNTNGLTINHKEQGFLSKAIKQISEKGIINAHEAKTLNYLRARRNSIIHATDKFQTKLLTESHFAVIKAQVESMINRTTTPTN